MRTVQGLIGRGFSLVSGGGITVPRSQQLFMLVKQQGHEQLADWAQFVWANLSSQGQRLLKEGKTLETARDNLAELTVQAQTFADIKLPIHRALQIA